MRILDEIRAEIGRVAANGSTSEPVTSYLQQIVEFEIKQAVAAERARCLAWVEYYLAPKPHPVLAKYIREAIETGTVVRKEDATP